MLKVGIVGLPNVGKSSLFNALTAAGAAADNYPFCTVDPNVGTVEVSDQRLATLHSLTGARDRIPTFIQFVDIAGLVRGASEGEGLGNQFLGQIREVDAIAHVLRCFEDPDVTHVMGSVDPIRDLGVVETELALADLEMVERRMERVEKKARSGEADAKREMDILEHLHRTLASGGSPHSLDLSKEGRVRVEELHLLTYKPVLYVANVGEEEAAEETNPFLPALRSRVGSAGRAGSLVTISSAIEAELALLGWEDRQAFLAELGLHEGGLETIIQAAYGLLGLITFFTFNEKEVRAWTLRRGETAPVAAGQIHTDLQRGFIRAETIGFEEFVGPGSLKVARDRGIVRSEGKEYVVADGDILLFRFNV